MYKFFYIRAMVNGLFITGTGTGVGKSYAASFLIYTSKQFSIHKDELKILYYKPIQCGKPCDTDLVKKVSKNKYVANTYNLKTPCSPHFAFKKENIEFSKDVIKEFLKTAKKEYTYIFMEGAGGVRTPITENFDMADLAKLSGFDVLLVASPHTGTINHTLLSLDYLKSKNIKIRGFMFSYTENYEAEEEIITENARIIEKISKVPFQGIIPKID